MKKILTVLAAGLFMIVFAAVVFAGNTSDPAIQDRIAEQQKRIDEGVASGELTRHEASVLQENLNQIKAKEEQLKADNRLTPLERKRLNRLLDKNSNMIYKRKHNPAKRLF